MIANVIWLYYVPFEIFQRAFPLFVIFVILCEAGILTAARVPWRRSLSCSIVANLASYVLGYLLVAMVRGTLLPANSPETFNLQSHLWRGFFIAFVLSVLIEVLVYSWMIRGHRFRRLLLLSTAEPSQLLPGHRCELGSLWMSLGRCACFPLDLPHRSKQATRMPLQPSPTKNKPKS